MSEQGNNQMDGSHDNSGLSQLVDRQRESFLRDGPPPLAQRRKDLLTLKRLVVERQAIFADAVHQDFGNRALQETQLLDLAPLVQGIDHMRRNLARWMRHDRRAVALHFLPGRARVEYQPLGVVGIISPWNYPFSLALMPLATALAAGNRAIIKPSELAPNSAAAIKDALAEAFSEDQAAVVCGGADVGAAFAGLQFDHLVFTGGTEVGRRVMQAAARNLVPATLELGGKSPAIVGSDYSLEEAATDIAFGKTANAGQTCIAPDYALVQEDLVGAFVTLLKSAVRALYPEGVADKNYTTIINDRHYKRLGDLCDDARGKGAEVIEIGSGDTQRKLHSRSFPPTIILGANDDMAIARDEIFGPILPVIPYNTIDDAIAYVNARPRPLALYYFGRNRSERDRVLSRTTSGNVTINDVLLHYAQEDLPFGGVGESGIGAYHSIEGFKSLSHAKGVFEQSRLQSSRLVRPPFNRMADWVVKLLMR